MKKHSPSSKKTLEGPAWLVDAYRHLNTATPPHSICQLKTKVRSSSCLYLLCPGAPLCSPLTLLLWHQVVLILALSLHSALTS